MSKTKIKTVDITETLRLVQEAQARRGVREVSGNRQSYSPKAPTERGQALVIRSAGLSREQSLATVEEYIAQIEKNNIPNQDHFIILANELLHSGIPECQKACGSLIVSALKKQAYNFHSNQFRVLFNNLLIQLFKPAINPGLVDRRVMAETANLAYEIALEVITRHYPLSDPHRIDFTIHNLRVAQDQLPHAVLLLSKSLDSNAYTITPDTIQTTLMASGKDYCQLRDNLELPKALLNIVSKALSRYYLLVEDFDKAHISKDCAPYSLGEEKIKCDRDTLDCIARGLREAGFPAHAIFLAQESDRYGFELNFQTLICIRAAFQELKDQIPKHFPRETIDCEALLRDLNHLIDIHSRNPYKDKLAASLKNAHLKGGLG